MFDEKAALKSLHGRTFTGTELRQQLDLVVSCHAKEIPVEFDSDELFALACRHKWVHEIGEGLFQIEIP